MDVVEAGQIQLCCPSSRRIAHAPLLLVGQLIKLNYKRYWPTPLPGHFPTISGGP